MSSCSKKRRYDDDDVVPYFLKFWKQYIVHGEGCYKCPETVSGQPYSLVENCPCVLSIRNPGVPTIFLVSPDPSLLPVKQARSGP